MYLTLPFCCLAQENEGMNGEFSFNELTFHSSQCSVSYPKISMNLYSDKRIEISRRIFTKKGEISKDFTGNFKGYIGDKQFGEIIKLLENIDWNKLIINDTVSCEFPIRTIIFSYNGENKKFKSIQPPAATRKLIKYLVKLCSTISLPVYSKPIDFEIID